MDKWRRESNMRVYIQTKQNGRHMNVNTFNADEGFQMLGIETVPFFRYDELKEKGIQREDIVVSGVGVTEKRLGDLGIEVPFIDYPDDLQEYLGRKIWKSDLNTISGDPKLWPIFIKPIKNKRFTGKVIREFQDLIGCSSFFDNDAIYCSEVIQIKSEYRVFIRYGEVIGVKQYSGDWRAQLNNTTVESAIKTYEESGKAPSAYGIDFGVTVGGRTILIEVNDGYSIGCYGLPGLEYAKFLSARWSQLVGVEDACKNLEVYG